MYAHRFVSILSGALLTASFTSGCDPADAEVDGTEDAGLDPRKLGGSGVWLNTSSIGSKVFSEFDLDKKPHDGVRLMHVKVKHPNNKGNYIPASSSEVVDGQLRVKAGNTAYTGAGLVGSLWQIKIPDYDYGYNDNSGHKGDNGEREVEIWISEYTEIASNEGLYTFQTHDEQGQEVYICDADASGSHAAIPVRDITVNRTTGDIDARPSTAYLACVSGAIGKAIGWGYKPWERSLPDFEVATRMVRADYCFDGKSWTTTGTALQVRDAYSINDFPYATKPTEVVWTKTGVACLTQPRSSTYVAPQITCGGQALTTCPSNVSLTTYPDTLFWTKVSE